MNVSIIEPGSEKYFIYKIKNLNYININKFPI